jgi:hypothetical protein
MRVPQFHQIRSVMTRPGTDRRSQIPLISPTAFIMDATQRKKVSVISRYAADNFSQSDWLSLGHITGELSTVQNHPRLFRAMSFGDDDYESSAAEVLGQIFERSDTAIDDVVDHFDIDLWYQQKYPDKYQRVFGVRNATAPTFWKPECLRVFVSHLARNRRKVAQLKLALDDWGASSFIAHQDIEPSREWQSEIESALATMDVMVALIEPGFRDSPWTDQEVGHALGRGVDVVPVLVGIDPHGFIAKIQGIQAKDRKPSAVAEDIALVLLRRPRHRKTMLPGITRFLVAASEDQRRSRIRKLDGLISDDQMKVLLEGGGLSEDDRKNLSDLAARVGAFKQSESDSEVDDIPF